MAILLLLILALLAGRSQIAPVRRWLEIASFNIQPAELAKPLLILSLGRFLADREEERDSFRPVLLAFIYLLLPAALIFLQPNLSTAVVILAIGTGMLFAWGIRLRHLFTVGLMLKEAISSQRRTGAIWLRPARRARISRSRMAM